MQIALSLEQEFYWRLPAQDFEHRIINRLCRLHGPLDMAALVKAVSDVVARHEPLRLRLDRASGMPVQEITPFRSDLPVNVVDGTHHHDLQAVLDEGWRRSVAPLDVAREGPLRIDIIRLARDDHLLAVTEHDIASDAWSTRLFHAELFASYAFRTGGGPPLPPIASSYSEHIRVQQAAGAAIGPERLAHWRSVYAGECWVPARARNRSPSNGILLAADAGADREETARLRAFAVAERVTPYTSVLVVTALACWLAWQRPSFRITTTLLGRDTAAAREMVGLFHRLTDLRFDIDPNASLSDFARATMATTLKALAACRPPYSYTRVLDELSAEGLPIAQELQRRATTGAGGASLTIAFEFVAVADDPGNGCHPLTIENVDLSRYMATVHYTAYDLIVVIAVGAAMAIRVFHNEDVVSAEEAERFLGCILAITRTCGTADASAPLATLLDTAV